MSDLSPKERALLEVVRAEWGPGGDVTAPTPAAIRARLAEKPWLDHAAASPASRFVRFASVTLAAIGVCSVGFMAFRTGAPSRPAVAEAPAHVTATGVASPEPLPEVAPTVAIETLPDAPAIARAASSEARAAAKKAPEPSSTERPSSVDVDTLAEELELIRAAQSALRTGASDRALASLASHATRFPRGVLRDERMTLQVLALCARGDVAAARNVKTELERSSPGSSHLQRLASSCAQ